MREKLVRVAASWRVCLSFVVLWTVLVQNFQWKLLYYTGDEPHYMMSVVSFILDGDFNNLNNYQRADYKRFGYDKLGPQFAAYGFKRPDIVPAEHGTAFPILISPAFLVYGVDGVRIFLLVLSTAACLFLGAAVRMLSGSAVVGNLAAILLAISPTWQMQSSRIYPESTAGFMTAVVLFILARHASTPERRVENVALFVAGLFTALMPLLYTKYAGLSAGLGLAIVLLPSIRIRPAIWIGIAVAGVLGAANVMVWGEEGALTGNASIHQTYNFAIEGAFSRYWRPLFDRHHGIVPFQPFIILFLWPMVSYLRPPSGPDREKKTVLTGAAIAVLLYTVIHGIWKGGPGYSVPGRYLTAALPLMCALIAIWAMRIDRWRSLRLGLIGAGAVVAIAFYVVAMAKNTPPYYVLWNFTYLFPRYWDSWDAHSKLEMRPVIVRDWIIPLALLTGTKAAAWLWERHPSPVSVAAD
jgi:hypothetical protein